MQIEMRVAGLSDLETVSSILIEAAKWLEGVGIPLWRENELSVERIRESVIEGEFILAECDGVAVGTFKYQLEDKLFWPDVPGGQSAYVHRVAVRRAYAGTGISTAMLEWAVEQTTARGRRFLRLDCDAARPKLRRVYECFGFRYHSDRQVGPYLVARYEYDITRQEAASSSDC